MVLSKVITSVIILHFLATCSCSEISCEVSEATNASCARTESECDEDHEFELNQCYNIGNGESSPSNCPVYKGHPVDNCLQDSTADPTESIVLSASAVPYLVSIREYGLHVSWTPSDDAATDANLQGYQVQLHHKRGDVVDSLPIAGCACKLKNETEHNFILPYNVLDNRQLRIFVKSYPARTAIIPQQIDFDVPKSCHDPRFSYDPMHCSPPRYDKPTEVRLEPTWTSDDTMSTSLRLSWKPPPFDQVEYPNYLDYPKPTTYYLTLYVLRYDAQLNPSHWEEIAMFTVSNTEVVTFHSLNITNEKFFYVQIHAYVKCSGYSTGDDTHRGCGKTYSGSHEISVMATSIVFSSTASITSTIPVSTASSTLTVPVSTASISIHKPNETNMPTNRSGNAPLDKTATIVIFTVVASVVATVVIIVIMIILYRRFFVKRFFPTNSENSNEVSTPTDGSICKSLNLKWDGFPPMQPTRSPPHCTDKEPPKVQPGGRPPHTEPHKTLNTEHSVFLLYSPFSPEKEVRVILQRVYVPLRQYFAVTKPDDYMRSEGTQALWLSNNISKASAVLCVCNETFWDEWDRTKQASVEVNTLRQLVAGAVTHDHRVSKYALVCLSQIARSYYIPQLLLNSKYFEMTDTCKAGDYEHCDADLIKEMVQFVKETQKYVLPSPAP